MSAWKAPQINHEAWSESLIGFIRSKGLERELTDWCGGWKCPIPSVRRVEGATDLVDEAACLIWSELCPGLVMGDDDRPHYEAAARAVIRLCALTEGDRS